MGKITITVNPCGQGDSIMLEWEGEEGNEIGLIDCNTDNNNPRKIFEYIRSKPYSKIDLFFMTHPHSDHYSGIREIIKLCSNNKPQINISNFRHTVVFNIGYSEITTEHIKNSLKRLHKNSEISLNDLALTYKIVSQEWNEDKGIVDEMGTFNSSSSFELNDTLQLKCLSPSKKEIDEYHAIEWKKMKNEDFDLNKEPRNNPAANYLSSVFALINKKTGKYLALFTSDCEEATLKRFLNPKFKKKQPIFQDKIPVIQIPHHGSKKNYSEEFWQELEIQNSQTFLSVGKNSYGHPDMQVVKFFKDESNFSCTAISDLTFYHDDAIEVWTRKESAMINNDNGKRLVYELDYEGNCKSYQI